MTLLLDEEFLVFQSIVVPSLLGQASQGETVSRPGRLESSNKPRNVLYKCGILVLHLVKLVNRCL